MITKFENQIKKGLGILLAFCELLSGKEKNYIVSHVYDKTTQRYVIYNGYTVRSLDWTFCRPVFASCSRLQRREIGISRKDKSEKPQYNNNTQEEEMRCRLYKYNPRVQKIGRWLNNGEAMRNLQGISQNKIFEKKPQKNIKSKLDQ